MYKFAVFHIDAITFGDCQEDVFMAQTLDEATDCVAAMENPNNYIVCKLTDILKVKETKLTFMPFKG